MSLRDDHLSPGIVTGTKTLSVMLTYTCPAACANCGTLSSPAERTNLHREHVMQTIRDAKDLGFGLVVFTGGETTLRWNDTLDGIRLASSLGMLTRIVTNAHWAHSLEAARSKIDQLIAAGLSEINYSTGDEHVRFIPLERVATACVAAAERAFRVHVMIELKAQRAVCAADILEHPMIQALPDGARKYVTAVESPWMPLDPGVREVYPEGVAATRETIGTRTGCDSILRTYTLQADGRIAACCGLGMRLIDELNVTVANGPGSLARAIDEAENDFLKVWIRYKGPERILAWAAEKDRSIDWDGRYAHTCQACRRLYSDPRVAAVIREHYEEIAAEVLQCAWMDDHFFPQVLTDSDPAAAATSIA